MKNKCCGKCYELGHSTQDGGGCINTICPCHSQANEKCGCACHKDPLKKPQGYEHETKCCEKMNGFISQTDEKVVEPCWCGDGCPSKDVCCGEKPQEQLRWQEKFEDEFPSLWRFEGEMGIGGTYTTCGEDIKSFIQKVINQERKKIVENIKDAKMPVELGEHDEVWNAALKLAITLLSPKGLQDSANAKELK